LVVNIGKILNLAALPFYLSWITKKFTGMVNISGLNIQDKLSKVEKGISAMKWDVKGGKEIFGPLDETKGGKG